MSRIAMWMVFLVCLPLCFLFCCRLRSCISLFVVDNEAQTNVRGESKMCWCSCSMCCRFCCGAPTTDERMHAPVLHDASQIDYCRYWGCGLLPPITIISRHSNILGVLAGFRLLLFSVFVRAFCMRGCSIPFMKKVAVVLPRFLAWNRRTNRPFKGYVQG